MRLNEFPPFHRMPTYRYRAVRVGVRRKISSTLDANSGAEALAWLKAQGLSPVALDEVQKGRGALFTRGGTGFASQELRNAPGGGLRSAVVHWWRAVAAQPRVKAGVLCAFTRQLATLIAAGLPILRSLELLTRQERSKGMRFVLSDLAECIRAGESLSAALSRHHAVFDPLYVNMVRAGEAGGMLDEILDRLARFLEKSARMRGKARAALAYPVILMIVAGAIVAALTTFVVPKFEQVFLTQLNGRSLPLLTEIVIGISKGVARHFLLLICAAFLTAYVVAWLSRREWFKHRLDRTALSLPLFGDFLKRVALGPFCRTFGTLLGAGVPILQALSLTRDATMNRAVAGALDHLHARIEAGALVAPTLADARVFPPLLVAMVEVGEAAGRLPEMLTGVADIYDDEIENASAAFMSLLEPLLIVVMAVVVGTIVIALFLPMIEIIRSLSGG